MVRSVAVVSHVITKGITVIVFKGKLPVKFQQFAVDECMDIVKQILVKKMYTSSEFGFEKAYELKILTVAPTGN